MVKINVEEVYNTIKLFGEVGTHIREVAKVMKFEDYRIVGFVVSNLLHEGKLEDLGFRVIENNLAAKFYRVKKDVAKIRRA